jgi:hypothetical protein
MEVDDLGKSSKYPVNHGESVSPLTGAEYGFFRKGTSPPVKQVFAGPPA